MGGLADGLLHGATAHVGSGVGGFACLPGIDQADLHRIYPQVLGYHIKLGIDAAGKGAAVDPDHSPGRLVGVNPVPVETYVFHLVGLFQAQKRHTGGNGSGTAVATSIHIAGDVPGNYQTGFIHAGFKGNDEGMALAGGNGVFLAGIYDLHRPAGFAGQEGTDEIPRRDLGSPPESAADGNLAHPHFVERNTQGAGKRLGLHMGPGVGHPDLQVVVHVEPGHNSVRLALEIRILGGREGVLPYVV